MLERFVLRAEGTARTGRVTAVRVQAMRGTAYAGRRITIRR